MENNFKESLKYTPSSKTSVEEFLDYAQALENEGINIFSINQKTGGRGNSRFTILEDLKNEGIDIEGLCKKYLFIKKEYPIGMKINEMTRIINGNNKRTKVTDEQLELLKYHKRKKKKPLQELLEVLEVIMPEIIQSGESLNSIPLRRNNKSITLEQLVKEGYISLDTMKRLKELGYKKDFQIGQRIISAKNLIYRKEVRKGNDDEIKDKLKKYISSPRAYSRGR